MYTSSVYVRFCICSTKPGIGNRAGAVGYVAVGGFGGGCRGGDCGGDEGGAAVSVGFQEVLN